MRASTRRLHHSSAPLLGGSARAAPGLAFPARSSAASIASRSTRSRSRESRATVSGPLHSSHPRTISVTASGARLRRRRRRPPAPARGVRRRVQTDRTLRRRSAVTRAARRRAHQFVEPRAPFGHRRNHDERRERVVQLVGVANDRPRLGRDVGDRRGVEHARAVDVVAQRAAQRHRARAPLLERRVVEVGVRVGVEDLVAERRRLGRVDRVPFAPRPTSTARSTSSRPSTSIASRKQLPIVSRTSTWSGMRIGPVRFSGHAA